MTKGPWLASIGVEIFSTPEILGEHNLWNLRKFTFCLNLWFPPTPAVATWLFHVMWKHVSSSRAHRPLWARHQCNPSHKSGRRHVQLAPIYANAADAQSSQRQRQIRPRLGCIVKRDNFQNLALDDFHEKKFLCMSLSTHWPVENPPAKATGSWKSNTTFAKFESQPFGFLSVRVVKFPPQPHSLIAVGTQSAISQ